MWEQAKLGEWEENGRTEGIVRKRPLKNEGIMEVEKNDKI